MEHIEFLRMAGRKGGNKTKLKGKSYFAKISKMGHKAKKAKKEANKKK